MRIVEAHRGEGAVVVEAAITALPTVGSTSPSVIRAARKAIWSASAKRSLTVVGVPAVEFTRVS